MKGARAAVRAMREQEARVGVLSRPKAWARLLAKVHELDRGGLPPMRIPRVGHRLPGPPQSGTTSIGVIYGSAE